MQQRRFKSRLLAAFFKVTTISSCILLGGFLVADRLWPLPDPQGEFARIVLAEDGTPLWRFPDKNGIWRFPVNIDDVSPLYLQALLGYEDRWFYYHPGLNPLAIVRAAWQNLHNGRIISGGSTISMQVARLIEPRPRTFEGKLIEAWRTLQLEWHYSKKEILQIYINRAPFGGAQEGIGAASWSYLDKSPSQLTAADAALLAVLPQSPSRLRPDRYPERAQHARDKVLKRLLKEHVWNKDVVDDALEEQLFLPPRQVPQTAPLLALRVIHMSDQRVVTTTIDHRMQQHVESLVKNWRQHLPSRSSVAVLVVQNDNMAVRTYVGSTGLNDEQRNGYVDMVTAIRSPGSTLKPFLYALAMDEGLIDSESLLLDIPRQNTDYRPANFSEGFSGPVSASDALHRSLNVPAVQLLEHYGPKRFSSIMSQHGLVLKYPPLAGPNLSVILGGAGTTLESLVQTYSAFARGGRVGELRYFPTQAEEENRLLSPGATWITRQILTGEWHPDQVSDYTPGWSLAYKTGTSYGYRDAWAIGVNPKYIIGVWIGRPDGTPVAGQYGASTAVPLLNQINSLLASGQANLIAQSAFVRPDSVSKTTVCWPGGKRKDETEADNCRQERKAWILDETVPPTLSEPDRPFMNTQSLSVWLNYHGKRVNADCSYRQQEKLVLWPAALEPWLPVSEWAQHRTPDDDPSCPPETVRFASELRITGIRDRIAIQQKQNQIVELHLRATGGVKQLYWFLDKQMVDMTANNRSVLIPVQKKGQHLLSVIDEAGNTDKVEFTVE